MTHPPTARSALIALADDIASGRVWAHEPGTCVHAQGWAAMVRRVAEAYPQDAYEPPAAMVELEAAATGLDVDQQLRACALQAAATILGSVAAAATTPDDISTYRETLIDVTEELLPWLRDGSPTAAHAAHVDGEDPTNEQLVGVRGGQVVTVLLPKREMTAPQAYAHAAWLIAMADAVQQTRAIDTLTPTQVLRAVGRA